MAAPTRHTLVSELLLMSSPTRDHLDEIGIQELGDFEGVDLSPVLKELSDRGAKQDAKKLFATLVRSGVPFDLSQSTPISHLGVVSAGTALKLEKEGYSKLGDLADVHFPTIYKTIGYGQGKPLLIALVSAGVKVTFEKPDFQDDQWRAFIEKFVADGIVTWEDIATAVLAELNPPQVGTAVANAVKHNYPKGETMREVWKWLYAQDGKCAVSGKRLFLEADHRVPKDDFIKAGKDVKEADILDNFQLLTKRENVIKRRSHRLGGISFSNAAAVLMFVLFNYRPRTLAEFETICRNYGLTMSGIRFQEAWAMAVWLSKDGLYDIETVMGTPLPEGDEALMDGTEVAESD